MSDSLLTVAPVEVFGFLTDSTTSISMEASKLSVLTEKTFSLIGGDLTLNKTKISAPSGQINLVSIKEQGEIIPKNMSALSGKIKVSNNSLLDISGEGSGNLFIRAGQFVMNGSNIKANTLDKNGGDISIQAIKIHFTGGSRLTGQTRGTGNAAKTKLQATESVTFSGENKAGFSSRIDTRAYSTGKAGSITIDADKINFEDGSLIFLGTRAKGDATHIDLHTNQIFLANGSSILAGSFGQGKQLISIYTLKTI